MQYLAILKKVIQISHQILVVSSFARARVARNLALLYPLASEEEKVIQYGAARQDKKENYTKNSIMDDCRQFMLIRH